MIPDLITADHEGGFIVLRSEDLRRIARISAEDAIRLANEILDQADKALSHSSNDDD